MHQVLIAMLLKFLGLWAAAINPLRYCQDNPESVRDNTMPRVKSLSPSECRRVVAKKQIPGIIMFTILR